MDKKLKVGDCVSFIIDRAPKGSMMRKGQRHAGYIVRSWNTMYGQRVTVQDSSGFTYTVYASVAQI